MKMELENFCPCDGIEHFVDLTVRSQKNHTISIRNFKNGEYRVSSCSYKPDIRLDSIIRFNNIIPVNRLSYPAAAVLALDYCCIPDCIDNMVEGTYFHGSSDNSKYFSENNVKCPICGDIPDKYKNREFYHSNTKDSMYTCNIEPIITDWVCNNRMASTKSELITWYQKNEHDRYVKKGKSGRLVLSNKIDNLNRKINSLKSEKRNLKEEMSELVQCTKKKKLFTHTASITFDKKGHNTLIDKMCKMQSSTVGESYVYVLVIMKDDEPYYYVGKSNNPTNRLTQHISSKSVVDIERLEGCKSEKAALNRERELSYELAIEKDTTNILGGK